MADISRKCENFGKKMSLMWSFWGRIHVLLPIRTLRDIQLYFHFYQFQYNLIRTIPYIEIKTISTFNWVFQWPNSGRDFLPKHCCKSDQIHVCGSKKRVLCQWFNEIINECQSIERNLRNRQIMHGLNNMCEMLLWFEINLLWMNENTK